MVVVVWYPLQGYLHVWGCLILSEIDIIIFISLLSMMNWLPERCCLMSDSWKWRRQVMTLGSLCYSEKAMAPQSSILAWKIPWMKEPGRLQSTGSMRVWHDWVTSLSLFTFHFHALEKEMAAHSSVLAWRIPGTGEPGGLWSMVSHRGRHDWSDLAAAATYCFVLQKDLFSKCNS